MKRLFVVRDQFGRAARDDTHSIIYFSDKMTAKKIRNIYNQVSTGWHVSIGPDHRRVQS